MIYNSDDLLFQILTVGLFHHDSGTYIVEPRPYSAIAFRLSGSGRFEAQGKQLFSNAGDILFLPANMGYKVEYSVSESIVVHFTDCNYGEVENFTPDNPRLIEEMFKYMLSTWLEKHSVNGAKASVYRILDSVLDDNRALLQDSSFVACLKYLESHAFDSDLNIDTVSREGFMSASGMQRSFHKYYGMSPKAYLTRLRMSRALSLLAENRLSVRAVAEACGFSDEKYFSRAFKKTYGYPPSRLKRNTIV